jgi:hypothetical protein
MFNVGSNRNNYQLGPLAEEIASALPIDVKIDWYGDIDNRSYRVSFDKINTVLNWEAKWTAADGASEIYAALESSNIAQMEQSNTLGWYKELVKWHKIIKNVEMYGSIIDL